MSLIVTKTARESDNTRRIEAVLLRPKNAGIRWTLGSLLAALVIVGLDYTEGEMKAVIQDLVKRAILEDTDAPVPVPVAELIPPVEAIPEIT